MYFFFVFCFFFSDNSLSSPIFGKSIATIIFSLLFRQCHCHKSIPIIFFPSYFGNTIATNSFPHFFFPLFRQYYCHKPISTIFFPSYFGNAIATNQLPLFFLFEKLYVHTIFTTFL